MFKNYLEKVLSGRNLGLAEMEEVMRSLMGGNLTDAQIAGFLVGLRMKGESIEEIAGAARVMREKAIRIYSDKELLIDTCGTGGDRSGTFNISTTVAIVLAAGGLTVAKHGNRSVSSRSGSADVMEALGVNLKLAPEQVENCLNELNIGFLFAPNFHLAMRYAVGPRRELGTSTIFNILGPLTNPAFVKYQVLGVYDPNLVKPLAEVLGKLGIKSAMVVNGDNAVDELTLSGANRIAYFHDGELEEKELFPEELGLERAGLQALKGGNPEENRDIILGILKGEKGPKRDVVLLNSAAALIVCGLVSDWKEGLEMAADIIDSGKAHRKLLEFIEYSNVLEVAQ
ncbi:MAG TPA: anthranilate phosphoribosyltransferase [Halanaerobiales bacterium]|nr:anthranilate phosphoribosyltransferase [Halanaerobiales bacterium]